MPHSKYRGLGGIMRWYRLAGPLLIGLSVSGCNSIPHPDYFVPGHAGSPHDADRGTTYVHVEDLMRHIQCEIVRAKNLPELLTYREAKGGTPVNVAVVTLTLKVEDNGGVTPSLSFINPLSTGGTFAFGVNGNLNLNRQRNYTTSYTIDLDLLSKSSTDFGKECDENPLTVSLSGNLGIDGIMAAAIAGRSDRLAKFYLAADATKNLARMPTYGTTVQFTLTGSFDVGPTWTLTDIKGPSGSKGILNGGVIDTDTMVIAFSTAISPPKDTKLDEEIERLKARLREIDKRRDNHQVISRVVEIEEAILRARLTGLAKRQTVESEGADDAARQSAADAARDLTTNMILQNLSNQLH